MRIESILHEIAKEEQIEVEEIKAKFAIDWIIRNNRFDDLIVSVDEADSETIQLRRKYRKKKVIDRLVHSDLFIGMADWLVEEEHFSEAEAIFQSLLRKTSHDPSALNDYGALILNELIRQHDKKKKLSRKRLATARRVISKAAMIDRSLHADPRFFPAYENLCLLRVMEADFYARKGELFIAFILSWMSVEMSLYRIWYELLVKEFPDRKGKVKSLERWNVDSVIETMFLSRIDERYLKLKPDLDALRGIRNDILHGTLYNPARGQVEKCMDVALKLVSVRVFAGFAT